MKGPILFNRKGSPYDADRIRRSIERFRPNIAEPFDRSSKEPKGNSIDEPFPSTQPWSFPASAWQEGAPLKG